MLGAKDGVHPYFMYIGLTSAVLGPDGFQQLLTGERKLTDPDLVAATQLLLDLQPYYKPGFEATDYVSGKAIFAQGLGAMMVAGTADFTGFKQENPDADLGFIAWPGPEAGKYSTNTGMELLYTAYTCADQAKQDAATNFDQLAGDPRCATDRFRHDLARQSTRRSPSRPIRFARKRCRPRGLDVPVWYDLPETTLLNTVSQNPGRSLDRPPDGRAIRPDHAGLGQAFSGVAPMLCVVTVQYCREYENSFLPTVTTLRTQTQLTTRRKGARWPKSRPFNNRINATARAAHHPPGFRHQALSIWSSNGL